MCSPSATLAVWVRSWLTGDSSPDDVIDALHEWAPIHVVRAADPAIAGRTGLSWPEPESAGATTLLKAIRDAATPPDSTIRLVLPAPGDVRGLPIGTDFAGAAIEAGEGVIIGTPGHNGSGLVPHLTGAAMLWTVHGVELSPDTGERQGLGEAEYAMREAVRDAAETLGVLQRVSVGGGGDARRSIESELADLARHRYPPELSARAQRVLDSADRVAAILTVAEREPATASVSASGAAASEDLLRPLWSAVRSARLAAYAST
ncbi:hypothetical protein [Antrihabitans cavernicola]|uniref:Uncharacterized protein n=1 Tax=Antrihabitans cavernicola TaxID=2495913 RepID=A0A5A7SEN0_9NOCA|nr:hypothetical protein [Spelaeibacter cavernicola]KAA0023592.1 hypothetical protein FOY51_09385 [Spelaeibacter cavernicola]